MQARDAVDEVEGAVRERKVLAVGLDALERTDVALVELAAAEPDHRVGEDVGRDVVDAARDHVERAPAPGGADLEHPLARLHVRCGAAG